MSESETKQVTGVCSEISERGEWTTFHVDTGGQWPVKLSTKLQPLIELGRAAKQELAVWTYDESDGKINPNSGQPFKNRYLSKVEVGGTLDTPQNGPDANASPSTAPVVGGNKDRLIVRQTCVKAAAAFHAGDIMSSSLSSSAVLKTAADYERWITAGILEDIPF